MGMFGQPSAPTVIKADPGFELVHLAFPWEVVAEPIIAWSVAASGAVTPITLAGCSDGDWWAVRCPNGRIISALDGMPRHFPDAETWAAYVKAPAVAQAWIELGHYTAGEA